MVECLVVPSESGNLDGTATIPSVFVGMSAAETVIAALYGTMSTKPELR